jgi:CRISPR/Cas system-associated protein Csm6
VVEFKVKNRWFDRKNCCEKKFFSVSSKSIQKMMNSMGFSISAEGDTRVHNSQRTRRSLSGMYVAVWIRHYQDEDKAMYKMCARWS